MFMFEVQPNWYHIRPFNSLGWHVGFWNLVGALGFTLCVRLELRRRSRGPFFRADVRHFGGDGLS